MEQCACGRRGETAADGAGCAACKTAFCSSGGGARALVVVCTSEVGVATAEVIACWEVAALEMISTSAAAAAEATRLIASADASIGALAASPLCTPSVSDDAACARSWAEGPCKRAGTPEGCAPIGSAVSVYRALTAATAAATAAAVAGTSVRRPESAAVARSAKPGWASTAARALDAVTRALSWVSLGATCEGETIRLGKAEGLRHISSSGWLKSLVLSFRRWVGASLIASCVGRPPTSSEEWAGRAACDTSRSRGASACALEGYPSIPCSSARHGDASRASLVSSAGAQAHTLASSPLTIPGPAPSHLC
eukprot:scaffold198760_cov28-Tisochrysis_lutea.AAC.6